MEVDARIDLDELERVATSATLGPWQWYGNTKTHEAYLATTHSGRKFVMDFARWGLTNAQPKFNVRENGKYGVMMTLGELGKLEHPLGPKFEVTYRRQFNGIGHPDASHIAANSPDVTLALVRRIRELETAVMDGARTIEGWVTFTDVQPRENDPDWQQAWRLRNLVEKGTTR